MEMAARILIGFSGKLLELIDMDFSPPIAITKKKQ
jgi:hypothetical protein